MTILNERIRRLPWVLDCCGLSRTGIWRREKEGSFPKRVKLGTNSVGWKETEILAWIDQLQTVEGDQ